MSQGESGSRADYAWFERPCHCGSTSFLFRGRALYSGLDAVLVDRLKLAGAAPEIDPARQHVAPISEDC